MPPGSWLTSKFCQIDLTRFCLTANAKCVHWSTVSRLFACHRPVASVNAFWRPADSRGVTSGQNASNVSGVSLRTCQGTGPFLDQSRDRGSQHRHIAYIAQYIVTSFYKDAHRAGLATFRYHFTALYREQAVEPKFLIWSNPDKNIGGIAK